MNSNLFIIHYKIKDAAWNDIGEGNSETRMAKNCDGILKEWNDVTLVEVKLNYPDAAGLLIVGMFLI